MNNNEKRWIVLLVVVLLIAVILIVVLVNGNKKEEEVGKSTETANEEKYTTELNDGTKVNTSEEFNSTKMYGELEISNIQYTEQNGKTVLLADVTNKGNTTHENEIVKITILGENGEEITTTKPVIGKMEPGETVKINATITADVSNAISNSKCKWNNRRWKLERNKKWRDHNRAKIWRHSICKIMGWRKCK